MVCSKSRIRSSNSALSFLSLDNCLGSRLIRNRVTAVASFSPKKKNQSHFQITRNAACCSLASIDPNYISKNFIQVSPQTNFKYLFLLSLTTFVSTTLPKGHFLGLTLVSSQTLQSEVPGPHPDGHGHPKTT